MNIKIRLEAIAVIAAVVLFILADVLLMFGFINVFDSLDSSTHLGRPTSEEMIQPRHSQLVLRGKRGTLTTIDNEAVMNLKKQLDQTQLIFFQPPAQ